MWKLSLPSSKRELSITPAGGLYMLVVLCILIGAGFRQINLLMLVGACLIGPFAFSLIYGRLALRKLKLERKLPPQLGADERLVAEIGLTNLRRRLAIWMLRVEDTVEREGADGVRGTPTSVAVYFPQVPAGEIRAANFQGRLHERGRYHFGPLRASTNFPLGLVRHSMLLEQPDSLVVLPRLGKLAHDWADVVIHENDRGSQALQRRGMLEADFFGLREWRQGDSRRWIHWRTTARRGTLVVRQFEQRRSQDLALLVDLWQPTTASERQLENVELAIRFAATVIADACRRQGRNLLVSMAAQDPLGRSGTASSYFLREQMDVLALAAPHHEAHLPPQLGHSLALIGPATPTLLISTREIDLAAFWEAAGERNVQRGSRTVQTISVDSDELPRFYQD